MGGSASDDGVTAGAVFASVVLVDASLSHLDRAFTYRLTEPAEVGALVRVPFRGRSRTGVVVEVMDVSDVDTTLPVKSLMGPGLDPELVDLARWVAARYLSTLGEALAAIVPERVVSEEVVASEDAAAWGLPRRDLESLRTLRRGGELADALVAGRRIRAVWRPRADERRGDAIVAMASAVIAAGRGVVVMLPEVRATGDVAATLRRAFGESLAWLGSDRSARERYREWLALRSGVKRIAVGGRAAVFAPVRDLGLIVVDDEGHVAYKEGRAPRFHARTVADERARRAEAAIVLCGMPPSVEARAAAERGPYMLVAPTRADERRDRPAVTVVDDDTRLVPSARTMSIASRALAAGQRVTILTHRGGEHIARVAERAIRITRARAAVVLDATTPRKGLGRALRDADLIVATPVIAKDLVPPRSGVLAIVEADAALSQPAFRATEEAFATWWRATRWAIGGQIVIETRDATQPAIVALTRWDPDIVWRAEAARRRELGYPPFASLARIDAPAQRGAEVASAVRALSDVQVMGPVERGESSVVVVRAPKRDAMLAAMRPVVEEWRRRDEPMRVDIDPWEVLEPKWRS